jgi:predicted metal-dependent peptidase
MASSVMETKKIEIEKHSSLRLIFGRCAAWQISSGKFVEKPSIFECSGGGRRGMYEGGKFAASKFWRVTADRYWQYDDFTFSGVAAASYLINAHRFKIWFNPFEFYKFLYTSVAFKGEKPPEAVLKDEKKIKEYNETQTQRWEDIVSGKNASCDEALRCRHFDRKLYRALEECAKNKQWNFDAWILWSNAIITNDYIAVNLESVMVHEMYHIIWNHLGRVEERDSYQWNLATDYAINQPLDFSDEIRAVCITDDNESFFNRFIISLIKYLMMNDEEVKKSLKENFNIDEHYDFNKVDKKTTEALYSEYMVEPRGFNRSNKYAGKSADFYYRVLLESCVFIDVRGVRGYDKHGKWAENGEPGEGDGDGNTIEKDGKKYEKGAADGTEKCEKKDGDGEAGDQPPMHHDKQRGKGGREEHRGFDPMEVAASRREVRATIKDALERSGINPDDPDEIEKALKAMPGMDILGALILEWFKVKKKNWMQILKKYLSAYSNPHDIDYTMSRESRVIPDFFPGKKRDRGLDVIIQMDTSGSINYKDWNDFGNQVEEIGKSCDTNKIRVLQVHSVIASDEFVNLRRIKKMRIKETGGTTMKLGPEMLKREGNKKLLIIFTDGYIDHFEAKEFPFKIIMFLSRGNEHNAPALRDLGFKVITQDEE